MVVVEPLRCQLRAEMLSVRVQGAFTAVMVLVEDVESGNLASQFEVRVRDAAMWVGGTDQCCLGMQGETCPPGNGLEHRVGREPDTTHAGSTGIGGANGNGEIRDYLTNAGGS